MAFASPVQFSTNNYSEVQAALQGTLWCCGQNCFNFILELDSMLVVNMILGKYKAPWKLQNDIDQLQHKVRLHGITIKHCYREENEVADSLSKYATTITENVTFLNEQDLPNEVRGPLRMDRIQAPTFRVREKKHAGWFFEPP